MTPSLCDLLGAWFDGELGEEATARVREHVERCAACQETLADVLEPLASVERRCRAN